MTHEELRDRLLDLAYGELSPRDARAVEEHARECEACRAELGRIRGTRQVMAALPEEPAPAGGERILAAAAREAIRARPARRLVPAWLWGGAAAAVSIAVVATISFRLLQVAPGPIGTDDATALVGESRYAREPAASAVASPAAPPEAEQAHKTSGAAAADAPAPQRGLVADGAAGGAVATPAPRAEKRRAPEVRRREEGGSLALQVPPPASAQAAPAAPPAAPAAPPPPAAAEAAPAQRSAAAGAVARPAPGAAAPGEDALRDEARAAAPPMAALRAAPAPAPSRAKSAATGFATAPGEAPPPGADPLARYEALRASGLLRAEERAFPGCPSELWRRVERDPEGRVVAYAWEERVGGRRLRFEAVFGPDGRLASRRAVDVATGRPEPLVKFRVPRPAELDLAAPSRCER